MTILELSEKIKKKPTVLLKILWSKSIRGINMYSTVTLEDEEMIKIELKKLQKQSPINRKCGYKLYKP